MKKLKRYTDFVNENVSINESNGEGTGTIAGVDIEFRRDWPIENGWFISKPWSGKNEDFKDTFFTKEEEERIAQEFEKGGVKLDRQFTDWQEPTSLFVVGDVEGFFGNKFTGTPDKHDLIDMKEVGMEVPKTGDELSKHILTKYVPMAEAESGDDDFGDRFSYYDNIISQAVNLYIMAEEPNREMDDDYIDEISDQLKMYWAPI